MTTSIPIKDQIERLREAIAKDEVEREKAEAHASQFRTLQNIESRIKKRIATLQGELKNIQAKIVEQMNVTFDVSDDMTIEAAKETLINLEKKLQDEPGN